MFRSERILLYDKDFEMSTPNFENFEIIFWGFRHLRGWAEYGTTISIQRNKGGLPDGREE
jgi:hypothetical protein